MVRIYNANFALQHVHDALIVVAIDFTCALHVLTPDQV